MESLRGNSESGGSSGGGDMPPPPHSDAESGGGHDTLDSHKSGHTDPGGHSGHAADNRGQLIFREGGGIGLLSQVPKVKQQYFLISWLNNLGDFEF